MPLRVHARRTGCVHGYLHAPDPLHFPAYFHVVMSHQECNEGYGQILSPANPSQAPFPPVFNNSSPGL